MSELLKFLAKKPERDPAKLAAVHERFNASMANTFRTVHEAITAHRYTEYWLKGGRGSCKSSYASTQIVETLYGDPLANALVLRKVAGTLRASVYAQMEWALEKLGVWDEWECTVSPMEMTNKETGQKIIFRGLDEPKKIKSIKVKKGYFAVGWFEEAEEFEDYDEIHNVLQSIGRGKGAKTYIIVSYNPPKSANNWVNKEALKDKPSRMVHHSIYTDVPPEWLGDTFLRTAAELKEENFTKWRHVYGGESTGDGGAVFANLKIRELTKEELAYGLTHARHGLDFGFSSDPSALMDVAYSQMPDGKKILYIFGEYCKAGAGFDALVKAGKAHAGDEQIWADTEPRTIAELVGRGLRIAAARKGQKSRAFGMQWLEELDEIVIDGKRCPDAAREFSAFEHARNKDGSWRADYQDGNDHTIDAVRYALWPIIFASKRTKNFSGKGAVN